MKPTSWKKRSWRNVKKKADLSLYAVIDTDYIFTLKKDPVLCLKAVIKGGATAVQLRAKHMEGGEFLKLAGKLFVICKKNGVLFIINDRADIALACGADGVHVGQEDIPVDEARKMLGPSKIIGISATGQKEAFLADAARADYIGLGPVFATEQKDKKPMGTGLMKKLAKKLHTPIVAIGGINRYNIFQLKKAGIKNFCFISALLGSKDIALETATIRSIISIKENK